MHITQVIVVKNGINLIEKYDKVVESHTKCNLYHLELFFYIMEYITDAKMTIIQKSSW